LHNGKWLKVASYHFSHCFNFLLFPQGRIISVQVTVPSEPVFGKVGSTVLLPCTYNTNFVKGCNLAWSFIPTGGSSEKEVRAIIRLLQSIPTQGTASIEIQSIQPSDTGSYICRVVNPNDWSGNQQGTVNLEVLSMFSFVLCYLVVQAGGLSCVLVYGLLLGSDHLRAQSERTDSW
uniref:V-set and immunoglobulin domain containing 2 n=1 Tax=Erpetoichthys calabaricus TaxID=27687 RepID=A0A8C4TE87_ERPCA